MSGQVPHLVRASSDYVVFQAAEDEAVIGRVVSAQREEVEREIGGLQAEARAREEEIEELVGEVPF